MEKGEANETISKLRSALETAQEHAETLKVDYDTKVTQLQYENSDLQSELASLKTKLAEDKPSSSLGIAEFKRWMCESSAKADTLITIPDPPTSSTDIHHVLAYNSLVYAHLGDWSSAYEKAREVNFFHFVGYICPLIHASSLSKLSRRPWVILPRLSHKPKGMSPRKRRTYSISHLQTAIRTRAICCCSSRFVVRIHTGL